MSELLVPPGTNLLHIGPAKTGTTALQKAFHLARTDLREHGVVYPGRTPKVYALAFAAGSQQREPEDWQDLLDEIDRAREQRVCLSYEDFGLLDASRIRRLLDLVGGEHPHVLMVARRLDKVLPSFWQQALKIGEVRPYGEWLREALDGEEEGHSRRAMRTQGTNGAVERWAEAVGPENVTLLVNDEADRNLLPSTTEAMLGLPGQMLKPPPKGRAVNRSMTYHEAELVRMVSVVGGQHEIDPDLVSRLVHRSGRTFLGHQPSPRDPSIPALPAWALERVRQLSEARVERLPGTGVRIVGDPSALMPPEPTDEPAESVDIPDALNREAVERVMATLISAGTGEGNAVPQPRLPGLRRLWRDRSRR